MTTSDDIFESAVKHDDSMAGVFEYDGDTGYFYLYDTRDDQGRIIGAIHVFSGKADFVQSEVAVRWNVREDKVGLFIRGELWAVFDGESKLGGNYQPGRKPMLPASARIGFDPKD